MLHPGSKLPLTTPPLHKNTHTESTWQGVFTAPRHSSCQLESAEMRQRQLVTHCKIVLSSPPLPPNSFLSLSPQLVFSLHLCLLLSFTPAAPLLFCPSLTTTCPTHQKTYVPFAFIILITFKSNKTGKAFFFTFLSVYQLLENVLNVGFHIFGGFFGSSWNKKATIRYFDTCTLMLRRDWELLCCSNSQQSEAYQGFNTTEYSYFLNLFLHKCSYE